MTSATATDRFGESTALHRRDPQAFQAVYRAHVGEVRAYLTAALRNEDDVQEVTQQVFLNAFEALPTYRHSGQPLSHWLLVIAHNCAVSHRRKHSRTEPTTPEELDVRLDAGPIQADGIAWGSTAELHDALAQLPETQREVIVLRYLGDLETRQIAALLDRSEADVRKAKSRALARLRLLIAASTAALVLLEALFDLVD